MGCATSTDAAVPSSSPRSLYLHPALRHEDTDIAAHEQDFVLEHDTTSELQNVVDLHRALDDVGSQRSDADGTLSEEPDPKVLKHVIKKIRAVARERYGINANPDQYHAPPPTPDILERSRSKCTSWLVTISRHTSTGSHDLPQTLSVHSFGSPSTHRSSIVRLGDSVFTEETPGTPMSADSLPGFVDYGNFSV